MGRVNAQGTGKPQPGSLFLLIVLKGTIWVWSRCHSVMGSGFVDFGVLLRVFGKGLGF